MSQRDRGRSGKPGGFRSERRNKDERKTGRPAKAASPQRRRDPEAAPPRCPKAEGASRPSFEPRTRRAPEGRGSAQGSAHVRDRGESNRAGMRERDSRPPREAKPAPATLPTKVQTVTVTADEANMRVDRFLEARFPGLSYSHIQRVVRKGELRVDGKRADSKDRLSEGQSVRIPPLHLDAPKKSSGLNEAEQKTLAALKEMTLFEDDDVLVLNKPAGLAVQGGSGTTRHVDQMLEVMQIGRAHV